MSMKLKNLRLYKSTNNEAIKLIKKQNTNPTLIKSLVQTKGKGTMEKNGFSKKEIYFYLSFFSHRKKINFRQHARF